MAEYQLALVDPAWCQQGLVSHATTQAVGKSYHRPAYDLIFIVLSETVTGF